MPKSKPLKLVVDTNLWVSFIISNKLDLLDDLLFTDNFLLALAKDGKADFLLTGDKDLLELNKFGKTKIKTITSFFDEIEN